MANREAQQVFGGAGYQKGGPAGGAVIEQMSRDLRMMGKCDVFLRMRMVLTVYSGGGRVGGDYCGFGG